MSFNQPDEGGADGDMPDAQQMHAMLQRLGQAESTLRDLAEHRDGNHADVDYGNLMHLMSNLNTLQNQLGQLQESVGTGEGSTSTPAENDQQDEPDRPAEMRVLEEGEWESEGETESPVTSQFNQPARVNEDMEAVGREIEGIQKRMAEIEGSIRLHADSAGSADDATRVVEQMTELQDLLQRMEMLQERLGPAEEESGEQEVTNPGETDRLKALFRARGLDLSDEEFQNLMLTEEGQEMAQGLQQMEQLTTTIQAQKAALAEQTAAGDAMREKAEQLRGALAERGVHVADDQSPGMASQDVVQSTQSSSPKSQVREVVTPVKQRSPMTSVSSQQSGEFDPLTERLRIMLKSNGMDLSDDEMASLLKTQRGRSLMEKLKAAEDAPGGLDALEALAGASSDADEKSGSLPNDIEMAVRAKVRQALADQGMPLTDSQFDVVMKTEKGVALMNKMTRMVMEQANGGSSVGAQSVANASSATLRRLRGILESQGLQISDEKFMELLQSPRGQVLLEKMKDVEQAEQPEASSSNETGVEDVAPATLERLRGMLEDQGITLNEKDFMEILKTPRGQQLLQKMKSIESEEREHGLVPLAGQPPTPSLETLNPRHMKQLREMLVAEGMNMSDSDFLSLMQTPKGQELLDSLKKLDADRAEVADRVDDAGSGTPPVTSQAVDPQIGPERLSLMRKMLQQEGIDLTDEQMMQLIRSKEGKRLMARLGNVDTKIINTVMNQLEEPANHDDSVKESMKSMLRSRGMTFNDDEFESFAATEQGQLMLKNIALTMRAKDATTSVPLESPIAPAPVVVSSANDTQSKREKLARILASRGIVLTPQQIEDFIKTPKGKELFENVDTLEIRALAVEKLRGMLEERGMKLSQAEMVQFIETERGQELLEQVILVAEQEVDQEDEPEESTSLSEEEGIKRLRAVFSARGIDLPDSELLEFARSDRGQQLIANIDIVEQVEHVSNKPKSSHEMDDGGKVIDENLMKLKGLLEKRGFNLNNDELIAISETEKGKQMLALIREDDAGVAAAVLNTGSATTSGDNSSDERAQLREMLKRQGHDLTVEEINVLAETDRGKQMIAMIRNATNQTGVPVAIPEVKELPQNLQQLKQRLIALGHSPTDEQVIQLASTDMGKKLISLLHTSSENPTPEGSVAQPSVSTSAAENKETAPAEDINFIREILAEKGINASEEDLLELAGSDRGRDLIRNMRGLKNQQATALTMIPIVQTFRAKLAEQGHDFDDETFQSLISSEQGKRMLSVFIEENKKLTDGLNLSDEQRVELEKTEEGRDMLAKYAQIKGLQSSMTALQKTLGVSAAPKAEAPTAALVDSNTPSTDVEILETALTSRDRLRAILKLRGIEMSDDEFDEVLASEQGQEMVRRIDELQTSMSANEEERAQRVADTTDTIMNAQENVLDRLTSGQEDIATIEKRVHDMGLSDSEAKSLATKVSELKRLQGMLMSLRSRVDGAGTNIDGSMDDAGIEQIRGEFRRLKEAMGNIQGMTESVLAEGGDGVQVSSSSLNSQPGIVDDFDVSSPRPKTSRRVPRPTPEEYTDYMPPKLRAAPPLTQSKARKYSVEQAVIHTSDSNTAENSNRPKTSRRTPQPSPEAFMDYVSPSRRNKLLQNGEADGAPVYHVEMESFEENAPLMFDEIGDGDPFDADGISQNAVAVLMSDATVEYKMKALEQVLDSVAGEDVFDNAYSRLRSVTVAIIGQLVTDGTRNAPAGTLHAELDAIINRDGGQLDFMSLLLRELKRSPTYDDNFRMKCLRFFAETQSEGPVVVPMEFQNRVLNAPLHQPADSAGFDQRRSVSENNQLSPGSVRLDRSYLPKKRRMENQKVEKVRNEAEHQFVQQMSFAPSMSPNPRRAHSQNAPSNGTGVIENTRYSDLPQSLGASRRKSKFPKNQPFDYVENVRASIASSIATEMEEGYQNDVVEPGSPGSAMRNRALSSSAEGSSPGEEDDGAERTSADDSTDNSDLTTGDELEWDRTNTEQASLDHKSSNFTLPHREPSSVGFDSDDEDQGQNSDDGWHHDDANTDRLVVPTAKTKAVRRESTNSKYEQIVQNLQKKLPELVEGMGLATMTRATLMRVCRSILREVRSQHDAHFTKTSASPPKWSGPRSLSRTGPALDPQLKKSIEKAVEKYEGLNAVVHKDELTQDISDILYDELIFHRIVRKLEADYAKDMVELDERRDMVGASVYKEAVDRLMRQKQQDLQLLHDERQQRLAGENPQTSEPDSEDLGTESGGTAEEGDDEDYGTSDAKTSGAEYASQPAGSKSLTRMQRHENLERSPNAASIVARVLDEQFSAEGGQDIDDDGFVNMGTLPLPTETPALAAYIDTPDVLNLSETRRAELQRRFQEEEEHSSRVADSPSAANAILGVADSALTPEEYQKFVSPGLSPSAGSHKSSEGQKTSVVQVLTPSRSGKGGSSKKKSSKKSPTKRKKK